VGILSATKTKTNTLSLRTQQSSPGSCTNAQYCKSSFLYKTYLFRNFHSLTIRNAITCLASGIFICERMHLSYASHTSLRITRPYCPMAPHGDRNPSRRHNCQGCQHKQDNTIHQPISTLNKIKCKHKSPTCFGTGVPSSGRC
jgi:hypothetical protein